MLPHADQSFDVQIDRYVALGYPRAAGSSDEGFRNRLEPLRSAAEARHCLIVITAETVSAEHAMAAVSVGGKSGYVDMDPDTPETFAPIESVSPPDTCAYLVFDADPGDELRDVTPDDALARIEGSGRSPLTIDEGVSLTAQCPGLLEQKHFFSLLASRSDRQGAEKRVPAIWISHGAPRLGWCWAGNPHSWLGSASCLRREAA